MNTWIRTAVWGLLGSTTLGMVIGQSAALALPQSEIVTKLERVPVFLILNGDGQPLTVSPSEERQDAKFPVVFMDAQEAEEALDNAREQDTNAQIALLDLGTLYEQTQTDEGEVPLMYFPEEDELQAATTLQEEFRGVPLFLARQGSDGPYLTINQNGQSSLPVFFSRQDLQSLLDRFLQQNAEVTAEDISVQVLSLEWLLQAMRSNDDPALDEQLQQIRLFPSSDVLQYVRSQIAEPDSGADGVTPEAE
ncbi:Tic22 protein, chloroplast protein import component [Halomicronema hongdechloris C2206]|uniref:Tic22 protein, chloroplast protein import component n=1 Tax=Halomicronema hongdechloris C2206 TaxID=1641165 RepID=A0A1Z3HKS8_9CYAN|nr:Tic22 family protein [Halomicronema hongdechloris]ASC70866.1 Tic22 protein, chloroplast protein import component [Halomicronema hongdechloris C2206]